MKLAILVLLFFLLRLIPIFLYNFPYSYDNAKDSLVMQEMWTYKKPALLGAVTSMEGLYQGPLWYYLMLPLNIIFGFDPIASVLSIMLLGCITMIVLYRYLGFFEAFLFTISTSVIATQQTAWSPYLTLFSTAWALIIFTKLTQKPKTLHLVFLAFSLSLLFHAEIAFAVVFCLLSVMVLIRMKIRPTRRQIILSLAIFALPFLPQAVFELRHNFLETRAVIRFVTNYSTEKSKVQENKSGFARVEEVAGGFVQSALGSVSLIIVLLAGLSIYRSKGKIPSQVTMIVGPLLIGSFLLYLFLPYKPFYLVGLTPFWIYLFAQVIKRTYPKAGRIIGVLVLILALVSMYSSRVAYSKVSKDSAILLAPKLLAVDTAYRLADGKPFASYQYVPEVYDYVYQHIYQYTATKTHRALPVEYTYSPGESAYMTTQKAVSTNRQAETTILIVEADPRPQFFPVWWEKMTNGKTIVATEKINDAITVYQLK